MKFIRGAEGGNYLHLSCVSCSRHCLGNAKNVPNLSFLLSLWKILISSPKWKLPKRHAERHILIKRKTIFSHPQLGSCIITFDMLKEINHAWKLTKILCKFSSKFEAPAEGNAVCLWRRGLIYGIARMKNRVLPWSTISFSKKKSFLQFVYAFWLSGIGSCWTCFENNFISVVK